jgi:hypothetical protein
MYDQPIMLTEEKARREFTNYFVDLCEELEAEGAGAGVDKAHEWEVFIEHMIADGMAPEAARAWRAPRDRDLFNAVRKDK